MHTNWYCVCFLLLKICSISFCIYSIIQSIITDYYYCDLLISVLDIGLWSIWDDVRLLICEYCSTEHFVLCFFYTDSVVWCRWSTGLWRPTSTVSECDRTWSFETDSRVSFWQHSARAGSTLCPHTCSCHSRTWVCTLSLVVPYLLAVVQYFFSVTNTILAHLLWQLSSNTHTVFTIPEWL